MVTFSKSLPFVANLFRFGASSYQKTFSPFRKSPAVFTSVSFTVLPFILADSFFGFSVTLIRSSVFLSFTKPSKLPAAG